MPSRMKRHSLAEWPGSKVQLGAFVVESRLRLLERYPMLSPVERLLLVVPGEAQASHMYRVRTTRSVVKPIGSRTAGAWDSAGLRGFAGTDVALDSVSRDPLFRVEVVGALEVHPEFGRRPEVARQPEGRARGDAPASIDDLADSRDRHPEVPPQAVDAPPSVVVHHFDLLCGAVLPDEADAMLIVGLRNPYLLARARVIMCGD
jgi:hypothetical protein